MKLQALEQVILNILISIHKNYIELQTGPIMRDATVLVYQGSSKHRLLDDLENENFSFGRVRNDSTGLEGRERLHQFLILLATAKKKAEEEAKEEAEEEAEKEAKGVNNLLKEIFQSNSYRWGNNFKCAIHKALGESAEVELQDGTFRPCLAEANIHNLDIELIGERIHAEQCNQLEVYQHSVQQLFYGKNKVVYQGDEELYKETTTQFALKIIADQEAADDAMAYVCV